MEGREIIRDMLQVPVARVIKIRFECREHKSEDCKDHVLRPQKTNMFKLPNCFGPKRIVVARHRADPKAKWLERQR